ncbi:MAG: tRNA-specific 2-thiouridylase, partial [Candidatus Taylorbacteria bacterium]|nr:tRNA-specific 2-thiouridylase [Candidatus Taylorbacteria bacterium]
MTRQLKSKKARPEHGRRVFVGLSGGVDSSVSAALLKKAGFDVHGVFIRTWLPEWLPCTWKEERQDAMRVAAHLDIPFTTLDLEKEYKKDVADYMIAEYKAGRTPNPDVMCNKYIKFGAFYDWAMKEGASYVATGHYARVDRIEKHISEPERLTRNFNLSAIADKLKSDTGRDERYRLLAGVDKNKDQSYFLWTLKEEQLAHILFPVGQFKKPEVRKLAESFGLPTAATKDSQGL